MYTLHQDYITVYLTIKILFKFFLKALKCNNIPKVLYVFLDCYDLSVLT